MKLRRINATETVYYPLDDAFTDKSDRDSYGSTLDTKHLVRDKRKTPAEFTLAILTPRMRAHFRGGGNLSDSDINLWESNYLLAREVLKHTLKGVNHLFVDSEPFQLVFDDAGLLTDECIDQIDDTLVASLANSALILAGVLDPLVLSRVEETPQ